MMTTLAYTAAHERAAYCRAAERYEAAIAPVTDSEWRVARRDVLLSITGADLIDELHDVADMLAEHARRGDVQAIGRLVVGVIDGYADRVADRMVQR